MIDFFHNFPTIPYPVDGFTEMVTNVAIGEVLIHTGVDESYMLWKKELFEGDTPISVSDEIYKTTEYYWTLLYINNVINPYTDWFMSQYEHEKYVNKKYGNLYGYHHYELRLPDFSVKIVDDVDSKYYHTLSSLPQYVFKVSNLEYEKSLNEKRRVITVIAPTFIEEFVDTFHKIVKEKS